MITSVLDITTNSDKLDRLLSYIPQRKSRVSFGLEQKNFFHGDGMAIFLLLMGVNHLAERTISNKCTPISVMEKHHISTVQCTVIVDRR